MTSFSESARLALLQRQYEDLRRQWQSPEGQNLDTLIRLTYAVERLEEGEAADDQQLIA